tara:strand:- start:144 stop:407 length:264 start_codon:yes stop_codon:yes gene_type:complete
MINYCDEKVTARQYARLALEGQIRNWQEQQSGWLETDDDLMDDESLDQAFWLTWVNLNELKSMTLKERKEVIRIYNNQIDRLLKIVS